MRVDTSEVCPIQYGYVLLAAMPYIISALLKARAYTSDRNVFDSKSRLGDPHDSEKFSPDNYRDFIRILIGSSPHYRTRVSEIAKIPWKASRDAGHRNYRDSRDLRGRVV